MILHRAIKQLSNPFLVKKCRIQRGKYDNWYRPDVYLKSIRPNSKYLYSMKIFLVGMMGAGKSSIGKLLATQLGQSFIDLDEYIEKKEERTIEDIFKIKGVEYFREVERKALLEVCNQRADVVVATGGGTPCFFDNIEVMKSSGATVYLKADNTSLLARLQEDAHTRPLLAHQTNDEMLETLDSLYLRRKNFYEKANMTFNTEKKSQESIMSEIKKALGL